VKTLLKLILVAVVINAAYRIGMAEYKYSQLKESTNSMLALGTNTPTDTIKEQILRKSAGLGLRIPPEKVNLTRDGLRTTVKVAFHQDVEVFPGYMLPRDYAFTDEIVALR
jgi:hypothetical protein